MAWKRTSWDDPNVVPDDFTGGAKVRLTYPDGNVVIGKLTVEPTLQSMGGGAVMARVITPHSGDTWMDVHESDVEVWVTDAFEATDGS